jgi:hypothetical protein
VSNYRNTRAGEGSFAVLPAAFLPDRNQVLDHSIEWLHCVDLVGAGRAKERLDLRQVVQDEFALSLLLP